MTAKRWRINSRFVVSEIIDGELIAMDSANGKYFSIGEYQDDAFRCGGAINKSRTDEALKDFRQQFKK